MEYFYKYHENNIDDFLQQKEYRASPPIPLSINGTPLKNVPSQWVLDVVIDEDLTLTLHIEYIASRCKKVYNK